VYKFFFFLLISAVTGYGQLLLETVTLNPEREAWLTGDTDKTLEILDRIKNPGDNSAVHYYNIGYLQYLKGDYTTALNTLKKSLESPDPTPYAYLIQAKLYDKSGFQSAAYQQIQKALEYDPENYDFLMELARLSELSDRDADAERIYRKVIDQYDDKIPPRIALGDLLRRQKKFEQAHEILQPGKSLYPESGVLIALANLYFDMGEKAKSAEFLLQMCRAYPYAPEIQTYLDTLSIKYGIKNPQINNSLPKYKFSFQPDETINYKVKYGFITLGWVNVRVEKPVQINGKKTYPVRFFINSNPDFSMMISLHHIYESYIDAETLNAIRSRIYTPGDGSYLVKLYDFNYEQNMLDVQIIYADGRFGKIKKLLPSNAQDGVSMLYFARGVVSNKTGGTTTVVIDEEFKYGHITYLNEEEEIEVADEDINAIKIFARADFSGIAGMNGDAWGWFSSGPSFTPLQGKISILLGSITIAVDPEGPMN
jgi:tetratricopeptide (TPR) repeat protein